MSGPSMFMKGTNLDAIVSAIFCHVMDKANKPIV
jgi:hypothetical protein